MFGHLSEILGHFFFGKLAVSTSIFRVKIAHFRPWRPIFASPVNVFHTKEVSYWFPDVRVPKVLLSPLKIRIFGPKWLNLAQN